MLDRMVNVSTTPIVDDGVIISPEFGNGRPIPAIIIDSSERPDIAEYIDAHENQPPGDVNIQWGTALTSKKIVTLILKSQRPANIEFAISFNAEKHYSLVDGILCANGFHLQAGKVGDKVSTLWNQGKILIEVGPTGFELKWEKILRKTIRKKLRKGGVERKNITSTSEGYIKSMREFWNRRQKG
ncbi:hypothetical protein KUV22_15880 [Microbulbifer agarilyticus]|uniref:hypothetical protein n=1 Tax=Microbulbifer agarilyticus TaxID=260552 RepID=UPI001C98801C|nr:hypothetical protein [Microbulbifer agarilyticus]MBY6191908.1 hypothetical protein [Microbulbifer agarilyticus]